MNRQHGILATGLVLAFGLAPPLHAQTTGRVMGRTLESDRRAPIDAAEVSIEGTALQALTTERGDFILLNVPIGEHRLRVQRLGFQPVVVSLFVRTDRTTWVTVLLTQTAVPVEAVVAEVERVRLIEPEVSASHQVVLGRELRALPVDEIEEAVELTTGVSDGHFRGGRVGQETYKIDGLEVKNQLEAATQGPGLELSPTALEEIEVVTGGLGPDNGSALSGVVSYVTRRGNSQRWEGRASTSTDHWAPDALFRGFAELSVSAGGPLRFLGPGSTLFADLLAQGRVDAEPRARGLTCLREEDGDSELAAAINSLANDPTTAHLYCPFSEDRLPSQRGDKLIGFMRLDRPLSEATNFTLSFLVNRNQRELYTPEFKYNPEFQLGQRSKGYLGTATLDWTSHGQSLAYHVVARAAAMRIDRYLGVVDPSTFSQQSRIAGFGPSGFRFLGEDFARSPIEEQLASGAAVPGYAPPGGVSGSPFGPAAEGIFFTEGTPDIANWSRSEFIGGDLAGELLSTRGHALRAGASTRLYRVENYERVLAALPGSSPSFARFFPAAFSGYAELSLLAAHEISIKLGLRIESFRSGIDFQADRADLFSPVIETGWKTSVMPRIGLAVPVPHTEGRTLVRLNYGRVAQTPDFAFFLDSTIGDSLRTDIRRQGNPNLAFERGSSWELGATHLLGDAAAISATFYLKELTNLVTSSLSFSGFEQNQFTTGDFGSVKGLELTAEARWPRLRVRAGYALQSAKGVTSGPFEDPGVGLTERRIEFPLAFDRRHAIDVVVLGARFAGASDRRWGLALTGSVRSGFPLGRRFDEATGQPEVQDRLPWTYLIDLQVSREMGRPPGCGGCAWRLFADARHLLARDNVIALRRDTGSIAPRASDLQRVADEVPPDMEPIPRESRAYSRLIDLNGDGLIVADEMRTARFAAALDRNDPSLFFGEARQVRLGLEVTF